VSVIRAPTIALPSTDVMTPEAVDGAAVTEMGSAPQTPPSASTAQSEKRKNRTETLLKA
jgi:hypothetical protein